MGEEGEGSEEVEGNEGSEGGLNLGLIDFLNPFNPLRASANLINTLVLHVVLC